MLSSRQFWANQLPATENRPRPARACAPGRLIHEVLASLFRMASRKSSALCASFCENTLTLRHLLKLKAREIPFVLFK
jgi:hypothetical protein